MGWTGIEEDYPISANDVIDVTIETDALFTQEPILEVSTYTGKHTLDNGSKDAQEAICQLVDIDDIRWLSDGYHTFESLYHQRAVLFATIVKQNKDVAWKSKRHHDGELCFNNPNWFIVGIKTPKGQYTYHYETDKYWDMFDCKELERAPEWDGHTDKDVERLLSLGTNPLADINPKELPTYKHTYK